MSKTPLRGRARLRWGVLGLLVAIVVAGVVTMLVGVYANTDEGDPLDRVQALKDPPSDPITERERLLGIARDFVVGFNTYGPDLLTDDNTMPEYADLSESMTATFGTVFDKNVGYAEQTVAELSVKRSADVAAVGIASMDEDSAELLVAGTATFAYPNPKDEDKYISFDPERFRYQVSLVRQHGEWLVDDLDDLDDDLPSFAESSGTEDGSGLPGELPTTPGSGGAGEGQGAGGGKGRR